jgi:putative flippase GtrA
VANPRSKPASEEMKRVGKFGIVGIINTIIDFTIYNVLSDKAGIGLSLVYSNLVSTTVAMVFSFFANKKLVFKHNSGSVVRQAVMFYVVTAFGLYVLQTGTIELLTNIWLWPVNESVAAIHALGFQGHNDFIIKNIAKVVGTLISLIWNYFMYKWLVFK